MSRYILIPETRIFTMHRLLILNITIFLIGMLFLANSQQGASFVGSSFLRLYDEQYPDETRVGETAFIKGTVVSLVNKDMRIALSLESNRSAGKDWQLISTKPSETFVIPANGEVHYQFEVQFLKLGNFFMQSKANILDIPSAGGIPIIDESEGFPVIVVSNEIFPIKLEKPEIITESGRLEFPLVPPHDFPLVGRELIIQSELRNMLTEDIRITHIVLVKDENGVTVSLYSAELPMQGNTSIRSVLRWMPESSGNYTIETFVWSDLKMPVPLALSKSFATFIKNP